MSLEIEYPIFSFDTFTIKMWHDKFIALCGEYTSEDLNQIESILIKAADELETACPVHERTGLSISIAIGNKAILTVQLGTIAKKEDPDYKLGGKPEKYADYSSSKIRKLQLNPEISRSSQAGKVEVTANIDGKPVPGGAVAFMNGVKIGISGLSSHAYVDEAYALLIGYKLGFEEYAPTKP